MLNKIIAIYQNIFQKRPQTPKPPFPYQITEVSFQNFKDDNITLSGTLCIPEGSSSWPAVVLISGSGPLDRDETMYGHKFFLVIADYLARNGIASLRFDKRGVGQSTGKFDESTTADFASDAEAGIVFLKTQTQINPQAIGLIGHSEGTIAASLIAANPSNDVAYTVMLAPVGVSVQEDSISKLKAKKAKQKKIDEMQRFHDIVIPIAKQGGEQFDLLDRLAIATKKIYPRTPRFILNFFVYLYTTPWIQFLLNYDPVQTISEITCSVLVIQGMKDVQVNPADHLPAVKQALENGKNLNYDVVEIQDLNHLLQTAKTGFENEYRWIQETVSPKVLEALTNWIHQWLRQVNQHS
jgi:uncharacterized protein